jgi:prepilin-type N-terminal cleavage/methylation domain-containing protein
MGELPMRQRKYRHAVTLIEMIIVMILIATITGALAFNYQKSLDRGKLFATKQRVERLRAILTLHFSEHPDEMETRRDWAGIIGESGLGPPRPEDLLRDDWGEVFKITVGRGGDGGVDIHIDSQGAARACKE